MEIEPSLAVCCCSRPGRPSASDSGIWSPTPDEAEELVRRVECGDLDPATDTVERILNDSGLELRAGPAPPDGRYCGPLVDPNQVARLVSSLADARELRRQVGAPPPGSPAGVLSDWDGEDPASA